MIIRYKKANKKMPDPFANCMNRVKELLETNQLLSKQSWGSEEVIQNS
jgi:hypothetical protein